ncbi:TPA: LPXTG cell wall anchor domain-containing protein [Streptococcus suis]|nr:LPXTG cell wall anchor domain-containing protein [Streptococcus suis]
MKRSSRKKRLAKWSKLGLSLAAVTVLGGVVDPGVADFVSPKVYANEQVDPALEARKAEIKTMIQSYRDLVGQIKTLNPADYTEESWNRNYDGDVRIYLGAQSIAAAYNDDLTFSSLSLDGVDSHKTLNELNATYLFGYQFVENAIPILKQAMADLVPVSKPIETPTDKPVETPVEQPEPTEKPVETPTDTPIVPLTDSPTGNDIVNSTIQLVDQDGQILQTIQQSGAEGSEVRFEFPVISGYRVGKAEGFDGWTYMKEGTFRLAANKIVKVFYDKAPSIDALIRPEQRVEYQKVFDEFHNTILKAFEVYKKELGVDDITYEANDLEKIFADSNLFVLHSELVLVQPLFAKPVGLVLTDQDIINAIGWTPEYWDHQISYHKEITQELEKAMANIAAAKATPTDKPAEPPVEQPVEQPVETPISTQPSETPVVTPAAQPAETPVDPSVTKPAETPSETPAKSPAETPTNQPSADQAGQSATEPTLLSKQDSQAGTASPTSQSAPGKEETKEETKEQAAPASQSKQSTDKPASTSQSQSKTLPATGEASSVLHLTGLGLLGLAGLVVKRRSGKSS